jgi:hypothetical protein
VAPHNRRLFNPAGRLGLSFLGNDIVFAPVANKSFEKEQKTRISRRVFLSQQSVFLCSQTIVAVDQCHFFMCPHTAVGRLMKKIILRFIAGVIVVQNYITDNKTAKVTSMIFEPGSNFSTDAFPALLPVLNGSCTFLKLWTSSALRLEFLTIWRDIYGQPYNRFALRSDSL